MKEKYTNAFENVETLEATKAINDFVNELEIAQTQKSEFSIKTNALYDETFNEGNKHIKSKDIQSMIDLCNSCNNQIIAKINDYKAKYEEYKKAYANYKSSYGTYQNKLNNWNKKQEGSKPVSPSTADIEQKETELKQLATAIKNASFN